VRTLFVPIDDKETLRLLARQPSCENGNGSCTERLPRGSSLHAEKMVSDLAGARIDLKTVATTVVSSRDLADAIAASTPD
jgi:hypothetical protein